ncbi:MAG: UDP-N-acetylmuramoyl-L-alanine--D-glutamate ligase [Deltaproteobacteria bacterium]|nr:UDP-N-acetylmuramoyl-L-alanine--D-glutamate ligase [Deltaproteobacteria bacterium]
MRERRERQERQETLHRFPRYIVSRINQFDLKGKHVLVVGLASTGLSTIRFLKEKGAVVTVTDLKPIEDLPYSDDMEGVKVAAGKHPADIFTEADLIILSPGVPSSIEPIQGARKKGIEVISEIELAYNFIDTPIIAVTGTNGKTTTTALLGRVLSDAGRDVFVGGNIGTPLIDYAMGKERSDYVVAEVSSFQLEGIRRFKPYISILLNITEDHLDRYANFKEYADAKFNIFKNQGQGDIAVVNIDDPVIKSQISNLKSQIRIIPFSSTHVLEEGVYYKDNRIVYSLDGAKEIYPTVGFKLKGIHNIENIMAVIAAAKMCGLKDDEVIKIINAFDALPHRVEFAREINGVSYYDDSKGTNIGALQKCLEGFNAPIVLIAGGKDKGGDYSVLKDLIKEKVKLLILIGEARQKMKKALGACTETVFALSMEDAVKKAHNTAKSGDIVLLSPACSSFDMFKSYEERGDVFKKLVEAL